MAHETSLWTLVSLGVPISGDVSDLDRETGRLMLSTERGDIEVNLPPATLEDVNPGDHVVVEFPTGPSSS